ncbi:hypothetical protein [Metamycoplasma hyosynoviae]|uniref:hypothetical protein n=1 Tax=Metamycoplasma hyosynoviae TaxID=29559 RepID=UPI002361735D|nr:hypothetical protein [Metamycoplasma hyosynoviae]MDD1359391.1 hypothetical protein [Metamycoplasma hyosynoviae]
MSYLKKFNDEGTIKIPGWICIVTFNAKKYWLIAASDYKEYIYEDHPNINEIPSKAKAINFKTEPTISGQEWIDLLDLIKKVKSNDFIKTKLNIKNFNKINDYFYDKTDTNNSKSDSKYLIRDLVKGVNIDYCIKKSGLDEKENIKIDKLKKSISKINEEKKILDWIEPIFINDMQEIISTKWDHVGGKQSRKDRGAFFTPPQYVKKIQEFLKNSIKECENKLYLIIDRCAGSRNLEMGLDDEILKNTILNTYEFCEWVHLGYSFNSKCKKIKPPYTNAKLTDIYSDEDLMGCSNALEEDFNIWLSKYLNDWRNKNPNGKVIFLENPPFRDETANSHGRGHAVTQNYIIKIATKKYGVSKLNIRDISHQFIWSAIELFLKENDEYCLISPIKYWKWNNINFEFVEGFLSNRKFYNATNGGLPIIRWRKNSNFSKSITLQTDIPNKNVTIKQILNRVDKYNIQNSSKNEEYYAILSIGNMCVPNGNILTNIKNKGQSNKLFYVSNKNIKQISVLHCANAWHGNDYLSDSLTIMKSANRQDEAWNDKKFINDCLLWTLLTDKTKCWHDPNNKLTNEICISGDAYKEIDSRLLDKEHNVLIDEWNKVINNAKKIYIITQDTNMV